MLFETTGKSIVGVETGMDKLETDKLGRPLVELQVTSARMNQRKPILLVQMPSLLLLVINTHAPCSTMVL